MGNCQNKKWKETGKGERIISVSTTRTSEDFFKNMINQDVQQMNYLNNYRIDSSNFREQRSEMVVLKQ